MSNIPAEVHQSLQGTVSSELKRHILERCWNTPLSTAEFARDFDKYEPYFHHYQSVCQNCSTDDVGRLTHGDLLHCFDIIKTNKFEDCETQLRMLLMKLNTLDSNPGDAKNFVTRWILQTGRALLLLDLCEWRGVETLADYLSKVHFMPSVQDDKYRIPVSLNLKNLQAIGGLGIRWTNLLSEHLTLEKEDTQLAVFHQAFVLDMLEKR